MQQDNPVGISRLASRCSGDINQSFILRRKIALNERDACNLNVASRRTRHIEASIVRHPAGNSRRICPSTHKMQWSR